MYTLSVSSMIDEIPKPGDCVEFTDSVYKLSSAIQCYDHISKGTLAVYLGYNDFFIEGRVIALRSQTLPIRVL